MVQRASRPAQPASKSPSSILSKARCQSVIGFADPTGADMIVERQGFVETLQLAQDRSLVVQDFNRVRQTLERGIEPDQRLFLAAKRLQAGADIVERVGIARPKGVGPQTIGERCFEFFQAEQRAGACLQCRSVVGQHVIADIEARCRLLESPGVVEQNPALVGGVLVARIELEHMLKAQQGMVVALQLQQGVAHLFPQGGIVGLELDGLVEGLERFFAPALLQQRGCKTCDIIRLGLLRDRAGRPLQRVIVLSGAQSNQAHQVQGAGVIGIGCQQSLATDLSFEGSSRLQMAMAGFALRGGRKLASIRDVLGPAVSAVHRHFWDRGSVLSRI